MDKQQLKFSIYRYHPDDQKKPQMTSYTLEVDAGADLMLLAALERIKAELDPTLSYRRSCREGVCGSDGMNVNGKNRLACITPIAELAQPIIIRPLPGLPVVRDLVVDMEPFYQQYRRVKPYLMSQQVPAHGEQRQSPEERAQLDGLYECILCACCTTSCPSYWWNPDDFIGPAGLLQAYRFIADSRDGAKDTRLDDLQDPYALFRCRGIMNCVDVCPKGLNPTKAIGKIRTEMLVRKT